MLKIEALSIAEKFSIPLDVDFHALPSDTVDRILQAADVRKYRKPTNANGSRARYFHAMLCRALNQKTNEYVMQGNYGQGFEDETSESTYAEGLQRLKEYRENGPGSYRLITRRVPV